MPDYLEKYVSKDPYASAMYREQAERLKTLSRFSKMTDSKLGEWIISQSDQRKSMINVITQVGEERLKIALSNVSNSNLAKVLHDASINLLREYGEETEIEMPRGLAEARKKDFYQEIRRWCQEYRLNEVAKALVVLYQEGKLLDFLKEQLLTLDDVIYLVVEFYNDILDD